MDRGARVVCIKYGPHTDFPVGAEGTVCLTEPNGMIRVHFDNDQTNLSELGWCCLPEELEGR